MRRSRNGLRPHGRDRVRSAPWRSGSTRAQARGGTSRSCRRTSSAEAHGFSYYAVLRSRTSGATTTLPAGGAVRADAQPALRPSRSSIARRARLRRACARRARVASATWGAGPEQVGLEAGAELSRSARRRSMSARQGRSSVLDEANQRCSLRARVSAPDADTRRRPRHDRRPRGRPRRRHDRARDGGGRDETPVLRTLRSGRSNSDRGARAERTRARSGWVPTARRPGVPGGQWMPVTDRGSRPLTRRRSAARDGPVGQLTRDGAELVVQREGGEARVAQVGRSVPFAGAGGSRARRRSARSSSPSRRRRCRRRLRVYTDTRDEFEVLVLGDRGIVATVLGRLTAWAETAPLARFRLAARRSTHLGSTPAGVFVDRFDLEVS